MGQQLTRYQRYYQSLSPEKKEAYLKRKAEYRQAHREKMAAYRRAYRKARRHGEEPPKEGKRRFYERGATGYTTVKLNDLDDDNEEGDDG